MIHMAMRDQNSIEMTDPSPQSLLPKIDRRIDQHLLIAMFDKYRNPQTLVTRIVGQASLTIAPDRGNACRCTCTEESEFHSEILNAEIAKNAGENLSENSAFSAVSALNSISCQGCLPRRIAGPPEPLASLP